MNSQTYERLRKIEIENFIWVIYLGIIALSFYANEVEKDYFLNNDKEKLKIYRVVEIIIFSILLIIYIYFVWDSYKEVINLNFNSSRKQIEYSYLIFVAAIAMLISGIILLYVVIDDKNIDAEVAFN